MIGDDNVTYKITLDNKVDENILREIQAKHSGDVEGISELYDLLIKDTVCHSDTVSRIYYVAYTLALRDIEMMIMKLI